MSATLTNEGYIPHLQVVTSSGVILAPVKLEKDRNGKILCYTAKSRAYVAPAPMRKGGRLVFALPGGAEVLG